MVVVCVLSVNLSVVLLTLLCISPFKTNLFTIAWGVAFFGGLGG